MEIIGIIVSIIIFIVIAKSVYKKITIFSYEKGLKYVKGELAEILGPGEYWYFPFKTTIEKIDIRPSFETISGQEVLSKDGISLKLSMAAKYEIVDPKLAYTGVRFYQEAMYLELQMALRKIIGLESIDELLEKRDEIGSRLMETAKEKVAEIGIKLLSVGIKDIMFPGELKRIFAKVVTARKEGLAALEKARGETAALRNLANVAKMLESNPAIMQLRLIQALTESTGNTLILGASGGSMQLPVKEDSRVKEKK